MGQPRGGNNPFRNNELVHWRIGGKEKYFSIKGSWCLQIKKSMVYLALIYSKFSSTFFCTPFDLWFGEYIFKRICGKLTTHLHSVFKFALRCAATAFTHITLISFDLEFKPDIISVTKLRPIQFSSTRFHIICHGHLSIIILTIALYYGAKP